MIPLERHASAKRSGIMAEMQRPGRTVAGQDDTSLLTNNVPLVSLGDNRMIHDNTVSPSRGSSTAALGWPADAKAGSKSSDTRMGIRSVNVEP